MTETRQDVFDTLAGLLRAHGYTAFVDPAHRPAIRAPELVIGICLGNTAEEPEAHVPTASAKIHKVRKTEPGPPLVAYWCDDEERR